MVTITAITNARTASTRVPNKLLRDFAGTTIIDLALAKLNAMDFVEERILAVAEDVFVEKAKKYPNVKVKMRDIKAVEKGHVPMKLRYAHYLDIETDYILIFNPCHPFIKLDTLRRAVEFVKDKRYNSFTSVVPSTEWVFDANGNCITNTDPKVVSTNQGPARTKAAHAFHFVRPQYFRETGILWTFKSNDPALIPISEEEALDIDTELEFELCELLYRKRLTEGKI
jgi:CMP-N-acetylneuraminic acid synthetase